MRTTCRGIPGLKRRFGCRVVAPEKARADVPDADETVREGDVVEVGALRAEVWETPGHCFDHVTYWFADDKVLLAGDTLFTLGCGRVMESPMSAMWTSLQRLAATPSETRVYSGHDYVLSNARFALAADPDNGALQHRAAEAEAAARKGVSSSPRRWGRREPRTRSSGRASPPRPGGRSGRPRPGGRVRRLREWKNRF
jgi:hydroxyacylglutathione hydrolase